MQVDFQPSDYKDILLSKFESQRASRPTLSLRKFAQSIGLTPSNLSDIFKGRCGLSAEGAIKVADALGMTGNERERFLDLVLSRHARSRADREAALRRLQEGEKKPFKEVAAVSEMSALRKWYYLAAFELIELTQGAIDETSLSERLSISQEEAREAFAALLHSNLIRRENGRYVCSRLEFAFETPAPSLDVQNYHRQMLGRSEYALSKQPMDRRQFSSTQFTFDIGRLAEAKQFLRQAEDEFFLRFEAKEGGNCVYALNLQFFGIDRRPEDA